MKRIILLSAILICASAIYAQEAKVASPSEYKQTERLTKEQAPERIDIPQEVTTDFLLTPSTERKNASPKAEQREIPIRDEKSSKSASNRKTNAATKEKSGQ